MELRRERETKRANSQIAVYAAFGPAATGEAASVRVSLWRITFMAFQS